jgi:hypothetical protein
MQYWTLIILHIIIHGRDDLSMRMRICFVKA